MEEEEYSNLTPLEIYIEILKCHMMIIKDKNSKENVVSNNYTDSAILINKLKILMFTDELKDNDLILHSYNEILLSIENYKFYYTTENDNGIIKTLISMENYLKSIFKNADWL